jgi:hypothetical protein
MAALNPELANAPLVNTVSHAPVLGCDPEEAATAHPEASATPLETSQSTMNFCTYPHRTPRKQR